MRSTSPRHPRHAHRAQPDTTAGAAGSEGPSPAAPPRRRRARFLAIVLPATGLLVAAALVGMNMAGHTAHIAADTGHQAGKAAVKALAASPSCCLSSAISSASPSSSSVSKHHAANAKKKAASKATPAASTNSSASSGSASARRSARLAGGVQHGLPRQQPAGRLGRLHRSAGRRPLWQLAAVQRVGQRRGAAPRGDIVGPGRGRVLRQPDDLRHVPGPDEGRLRAGPVHQQPGYPVARRAEHLAARGGLLPGPGRQPAEFLGQPARRPGR